jgi:hypothetical protein
MISSLGYDPASETMVVQFQKASDVYKYNGVPSDVFVAVITDPESHGKSFNQKVRDVYPHEKLPLAEAHGL